MAFACILILLILIENISLNERIIVSISDEEFIVGSLVYKKICKSEGISNKLIIANHEEIVENFSGQVIIRCESSVKPLKLYAEVKKDKLIIFNNTTMLKKLHDSIF